MGLLQRLGLRRPNKWETPTLLDQLLASPLQFVAAQLYAGLVFLRGRAALVPRGVSPVRVVCVSDTHDRTVALPAGDLLIHAGDLTNEGTVADIQKQLDWLDAQPHQHKVVVCGNHDSWFDPASRRPVDAASGAQLRFGSVHYLEHRSVALRFANGRTLRVYGAPDIPQCGGDSFA